MSAHEVVTQVVHLRRGGTSLVLRLDARALPCVLHWGPDLGDPSSEELDGLANRLTANGQPLFSTGTALSVRYDAGTSFAPVPSRAEVFEVGGVSLSQMARDAASALRGGVSAGINASLDALETGLSYTADALGDIGQRGARLESLRDASRSRDIDFAAERSGLEATDLTEAIALLNAQTITLDAAQAAFARINRRTLFDLLS